MLLKYTPAGCCTVFTAGFCYTGSHCDAIRSVGCRSSGNRAALTSELNAQLTEITKRYLSAHPEILTSHYALLNDKATPSVGPADAKVALVEFFDYQCSVCAQQAPVLESLMHANPLVRYVFKEWSIFGTRWPVSMAAAETGLQIWQQKGADAYLAYHNVVFATGHNES